jgi:hypothetical protein
VGTQTVIASNSGSQNVLWECVIPQAYLFSLGNISHFWWMENSTKNLYTWLTVHHFLIRFISLPT